ncbi:hypothetical protein [Bacillus sp. XF8]|uniref:hypothetical protein n=1 Tax=Bacillus sp. XF8 TaxID=2819289 RepID=UPI001AA08175|nr:hypothetical protein [Bacillus sp. XF8]MBO1583333.1 hypothetical protein [Bacillus sp. XF8]
MNKKIIAGIIGFVVIVIALVSINVIQNNTKKEEEQKKKDAQYLESATKYYVSIEFMGAISDLVLPEYSQAWSKAIDNRNDFNKALSEKRTSMDSMISQIPSIYEKMEKELKIVSEAAKEQPKKYEELYTEYKNMHGIITSLKEQMDSPTGSLISFNQNVNMLFQEYKKTKGKIDVAIPDDVKENIDKVKEKSEKNTGSTRN